jgi:hypothetical protein
MPLFYLPCKACTKHVYDVFELSRYWDLNLNCLLQSSNVRFLGFFLAVKILIVSWVATLCSW